MRPSSAAWSVVHPVRASLCFLSPLVVTSGGNAVFAWEGDTRAICKIVVHHQFVFSALQLLEWQLVGCLLPSTGSLGKQVFSGISAPGEMKSQCGYSHCSACPRSCREMHWLLIRLDLFLFFLFFLLENFLGNRLVILGMEILVGGCVPPCGPVLHPRQHYQLCIGATGNVTWFGQLLQRSAGLGSVCQGSLSASPALLCGAVTLEVSL